MRRIAVRAIIEKDGKLLLVKHKPYNGDTDKTFYCTVGGGLDDNEGLIEGLKREVKEETGVEAVVGRLLFVQQYTDNYDHIEFFFHVTNAEDFEVIDLGKSSHGMLEIDEIGFFNPREITVLPLFLQELSVEESLSNPEVQFFNYL